MINTTSIGICKECPNFTYCPKLQFANPIYSKSIGYTEECEYRKCIHSPTDMDIARRDICASNRNYWLGHVKTLSDEKILLELASIPKPNCPYNKLDLNKIASNAYKDSFDFQFLLYNKSNAPADDFIFDMKDIPDNYINFAKGYIALMESIYPPETKKSARKCKECKIQTRFVCNGGMPDGYIGFPDIYQAEAKIRGLALQKTH